MKKQTRRPISTELKTMKLEEWQAQMNQIRRRRWRKKVGVCCAICGVLIGGVGAYNIWNAQDYQQLRTLFDAADYENVATTYATSTEFSQSQFEQYVVTAYETKVKAYLSGNETYESVTTFHQHITPYLVTQARQKSAQDRLDEITELEITRQTAQGGVALLADQQILAGYRVLCTLDSDDEVVLDLQAACQPQAENAMSLWYKAIEFAMQEHQLKEAEETLLALLSFKPSDANALALQAELNEQKLSQATPVSPEQDTTDEPKGDVDEEKETATEKDEEKETDEETEKEVNQSEESVDETDD